MHDQPIRDALDGALAGIRNRGHKRGHTISTRTMPSATIRSRASGSLDDGANLKQALRGHHPGKPSGFKVRRILGRGDLWITEYIITYQGRPAFTVSIMEFRDGKVVHETQYFADPFEAPANGGANGSFSSPSNAVRAHCILATRQIGLPELV